MLRVILGVGGALMGAAFGAVGGVKLGSWLKSHMSEEEEEAVLEVFRQFGVQSREDAEELPPAEKKQFVEALTEARSRAKTKGRRRKKSTA